MGQNKLVLMIIHISLVIPTIPKKFLLMAFFASGLFITNKAIPGKRRKQFSLAKLSVTHT